MPKDYTAFIAGLPEIAWSDQKLSLTVSDFREEAKSYIKGKDEVLLNMLFLSNDNRQVLRLLNRHEPIEELPTVYPLSVLEEEVENPEHNLPSYLDRFITMFKEGYSGYNQRPENILTDFYYNYVMECRNEFLIDYARFMVNLKNLVIAFNCKKHGWEIAPEVIGDTEFANALKTSHSKDYGLSTDYPWVEKALALLENKNLVERERGLDLLKWNYVEEKVVAEYFSIERVIAFAIGLILVERWSKMTSESGRRVFAEMIEKYKENLEFDKQFQ